jgi:hypothetical protein
MVEHQTHQVKLAVKPKIPARIVGIVHPLLMDIKKSRFPEPVVHVRGDGAIALLWRCPRRDLCIEFLPIGINTVSQVTREFDETGGCEESQMNGVFMNRHAIDSLLAWYLSVDDLEA